MSNHNLAFDPRASVNTGSARAGIAGANPPSNARVQPLHIQPVDSYSISPQLSSLANLAGANGLRPETYPGGSVLINVEQQNNGMVYLLVSGEAEVLVKGNGRPITVHASNGLIGEISALLGIEATATVRVKPGTTAQIIAIPVEQFRVMVAGNGGLREYVYAGVRDRLIKNGTAYFDSERSAANFYGAGEAKVSINKPKSEYVIPAEAIARAYEKGGADGLAELMTKHVIDIAQQTGDTDPLRHWMKVTRGSGGFADALYVFEMIPTGQTHLHPTRSLPLEFIERLGRSKLPLDQNYWDKVDSKVKPYIRRIMETAGFKNIRQVFEGLQDPARAETARETLRQMVEYHPTGQPNLNEYLEVGSFISSLYTAGGDLADAAESVARAQYRDGARVVELRFSADQAGLSYEEVIRAQIDGLRRAESGLLGLKARAIVIFDTTMSPEQIREQAAAVAKLKVDPALGQYLVGVDVAGPEVGRSSAAARMLPNPERLGGRLEGTNGQVEWFSDLNRYGGEFKRLQALGVQVTIHVGENFFSLDQGFERVSTALELGAVRLGHGVILGLDLDAYVAGQPKNSRGEHVDTLGNAYTPERIAALKQRQTALLKLVAQNGVVIEVCPDSNLHTNPLELESHPVRKFLEYGIRITFSNDNSTLDSTSGPKQILETGRAQGWTMRQLVSTIIGSQRYELDVLRPAAPENVPAQQFEREAARVFKMNIAPERAGEIAATYLVAEGAEYRVAGADAFTRDLIGSRLAVGQRLDRAQVVDTRGLPANSPLGQLAHGHRYLGLVPTGSDGALMAVGLDDPSLFDLKGAAETARRIGDLVKFESYIAENSLTPSGARNKAAYYSMMQEMLSRPNPRFTEVVLNFTGLKAINDRFGRAAGSEYLGFLEREISSYAKRRGLDVVVHSEGPNFSVVMGGNASPEAAESFMRGVSEHFARLREAPVIDRRGKPAKAPFPGGIQTNASSYFYDEALHNPEAAKSRAEKLSVIDVVMWRSREMSRVNTGEWQNNFSVGAIDVAEAKGLNVDLRVEGGISRNRATDSWSGEWSTLRERVRQDLMARGLKPTEHQVDQAARQLFIEPDSGLFNKKAIDLIAAHKIAAARVKGKKVTVGFMDGNRFGAFTKTGARGGYGILGGVVVDIVIQKRVTEAAEQAFAERGITFGRFGSGSEEFMLVGEVDRATMAEAMADFQTRLAEPLNINVIVAELMESERGRAYLEAHDIPDSDLAKTLVADGNELIRGEGANVKRLSMTGVAMEVVDDGASKPLEIAEAALAKADKAADSAKGANPDRAAYILECDESGRAIGNDPRDALQREIQALREHENARGRDLRVEGKNITVIDKKGRVSAEYSIDIERAKIMPKAVAAALPSLPGELGKAIGSIDVTLRDPKAIGKLVEYFRTAEGRGMLKSEEGRALLAKLQSLSAAPNFTQAAKMEGAGLLVGLVTMVGAEKLADILGIENKQARFIFVLGLSHMANLKTQHLLTSRVMGRQTAQVARLLENPALLGRMTAQFKGMMGGFAQMAFVSIVTKGALNLAGVHDESTREKIVFGTSFVVPAVGHFVAGRVGEGALASTGMKFLGRAAGGIGLASFLTDGVYSLMASDYRMSVNRRVYEGVQTMRAGGWERGGALGVTEFIAGAVVEGFHTIGGAASEAATASDNPAITRRIVGEDIELSNGLRADLRAAIAEGLGGGRTVAQIFNENPNLRGAFALLHSIDPSVFSGYSNLILNDDIRAMFNKDGTLKPGQEAAFRNWVSRND